MTATIPNDIVVDPSVDRAVDDTCPACDGAGEIYGDWRRDPDSGRDYAEHVGICHLCDGTGVSPVEVVICSSCPTGRDRILVDDNQCSHGLTLCDDHADDCPECVEDQCDPDLDAWDPWADER